MCSFFFLLLSDNKTVVVDKTFNGDTEEGLVVDVVFTGAGGRGTHRSAAGQGKSNSGNSGDDDKLFHIKLIPLISLAGESYMLFPNTPAEVEGSIKNFRRDKKFKRENYLAALTALS